MCLNKVMSLSLSIENVRCAMQLTLHRRLSKEWHKNPDVRIVYDNIKMFQHFCSLSLNAPYLEG